MCSSDLAEEDLALRGEGDVLGTRQSGMPGFRIVRIEAHGKLIGPARDDAKAQERFLGLMAAQAERMARLVNDLLALSSIELVEHAPPTAPVALAPIARNAAQALLSEAHGRRGGAIVLRTRSARQVTIARRRHKLALELQVIDDGPGVPEDIQIGRAHV